MRSILTGLTQFALATTLLAFNACSTTPGAPEPTPAQVAAQVCPAVQTTLGSLSLLVLPPTAIGDIAVASAVVNQVCAVGSAITTANLQQMAGQVFPALIAALQAAPLPAAQKQALQVDLTAASVVLQGVLMLHPPLTSWGTSIAAPAPLPVAVSAPVPAASYPHSVVRFRPGPAASAPK